MATNKRKTVQIKLPIEAVEFLKINAIRNNVFFQEEIDSAISTFLKKCESNKKPSLIPTLKGEGKIVNIKPEEHLYESSKELSTQFRITNRSFFYTAVLSYCKGCGYSTPGE